MFKRLRGTVRGRIHSKTGRRETVAVGSNVLAGTDPEKIVGCTTTMLGKANEWVNPFGDGTAGERIVELLERF